MATWQRKRKAQRWSSFVEYAWCTYEEGAGMAVAGGATAAYRCSVAWDDGGGALRTTFTTMARTECATVDDAVRRLQAGETVTVAGSDMAALRQRLASCGIG